VSLLQLQVPFSALQVAAHKAEMTEMNLYLHSSCCQFAEAAGADGLQQAAKL